MVRLRDLNFRDNDVGGGIIVECVLFVKCCFS